MDDFEAIRQLAARYDHALDARDVDGWLACWTEDGYFERAGSSPRARGHAALAELGASFPIVGRHLSSDFVVTVAGDSADLTSYCLFLDMERGCQPALFGTYEDDLVRVGGGWKFRQRIFHAHFVAEFARPDQLSSPHQRRPFVTE